MKLEGFELEVEGSRDDAALISNQVTSQIGNMLDIEGIIKGEAKPKTTPLPTIGNLEKKPPRKKRSSTPKYTNEEKKEIEAISFSHDPSIYGNPKQDWKVLQKSIWLLYVLKENGSGDQHPGGRLSNTFNHHFKQSGVITTSNINRDLGRAKSNASPATVGEDKQGKIGYWFLTDSGISQAQALVAEARGESG